MKNKFFLVSSLLLFSIISKAQQTSFGIKGGLNSSNIEVQNGNDFDSKTGLHFGGLAHIHFSPHFAVQPELVYSCQGGERGDLYKISLSYLNLPVLLQYMVNNGFRLQTGLQLGFLLNAKQKESNITFEVDEAYKSMDFSWVIGAGYVFKSGFGIDLRYNVGISDISDNSTADWMNRVLQLGLFYQFKNRTVRK